ncbi:MAG: hypothetical protein A3G23_12210 [Bacteroidetes bacterium RIFCSPLOWO2_12_FULL_37_12]|nr:MAG: hypothetical protein A3G23_12210 [Bacteroidetes bacterium RIFCSPLOWO2_12_FULL_37_12]
MGKNQIKNISVKNLPATNKSNRSLLIYKILFITSSSILFSLFVYAIYDGKFFPTSEDETIYYNSARLFQQTNSIQASDCVMEEVSKIGRCNWYGPFYNIFYGSLAKIIGYESIQFVIIHFLLILSCFLLIYKFPLESMIKWQIALCFILSEVANVFIFTYFPESFHLFSGFVLTFLLILIFQNDNPFYKYLYIASVLFFTFTRPTAIFWMIGLIPFAKNKMEYWIYAIIFVSGVLVTMIFQKFFFAPAWASGLKTIDYLYKFEVFKFINHSSKQFFQNGKNLFQVHNSFVIFFFFLTFIRALIIKNKFLTSTALICSVILVLLLAFYDTNPLFFIKQVAFMIPLMITANLTIKSPRNYLIILFMLLTFPFTIRFTYSKIRDSKSAYTYRENQKEFVSSLADIVNYVEPEKKNTILWSYNEYHYPAAEALIPLATSKGFPILYTTNITDTNAPPEEKFRLYNKLKVDYILSRFQLAKPELKLLVSNKYYYFYKNKVTVQSKMKK